MALASGVGLSLIWIAAARYDWSSFDLRAFAERVGATEGLGPVALFALLVVQCVVSPLPSEPLMMAAGFLYGPERGFALAWTAVIVGGTACFTLARTLGRPVAARFIRAERLAAVDTELANRGLLATFLIVLGLRLVSFGSFDVVSYACGLVAFPLRWFVLASAVGVVPKVFAFTYLGSSTGARPGWLDALILAGTFGVLLAVPWWWRRGRRIRGAETPAE